MRVPTSHYVTDWLEKRAQLTPDRIALTDTIAGEDISFAEWNRRANRTANLLRTLGVATGDLVSAYSANRAGYLDLLFACGKIGAILHNLNWRLTVHELRAILDEARPAVLIHGPEWRLQVDELRPSLSYVQRFVSFGEPERGDIAFAERDVLPDTPGRHTDLEPDHPWGIYYTGGTTGQPKGAVLTHANMTWNSVNTVMSWGIRPEHAAPLQLPFFHIGGPNIFLLPLIHIGGRSVLCSGFDVDQTFDLIERGAITHMVGVPTIYGMMQQHPRWETTDFSRLELVISGGAPCPMPVFERFWARGIEFRTGYGLTEASGNNFWLPDADVRRKPGSVGFPLFHIDVRIVAEDGSECGPGEPGELLIRGPHVFAGYWNRPEETARVLRDGWLHTGDLARRDAEGFTTIIGRSKDMFISGGENVYPAEIESALHSHPDVLEAAVIAVPHEKWGEVGRGIVVVAQGRSLDAAALLAFLGTRLARYKLPHSIVFTDALPRTAIGKIDKVRLAKELG